MKKKAIMSRVVGIMMLAVLALTIFQIAWVSHNTPTDSIFDGVTIRATDFSDSWYNTTTGAPVAYDKQQKAMAVPVAGNEVFSIEKVLSSEVTEGKYLCFRAYSQDVRVLINDKQVYAFVHRNASALTPSMYRIFRIELPQLVPGDTIRLVIKNDQRTTAYIQFMSCGDMNDVYLLVLVKSFSALLTVLLSITVGIIAILVYIHYLIRKKRHPELLYFALFSLLTTIWIMIDSGFSSIFISRNIAQYYLRFTSYLLMPATYLMFLRGVMGGKRRTDFAVFAAVDVCITVAALLLQQAGIIEMSQVIVYFNALLLGLSVHTIVVVIIERKNTDWMYSVSAVAYFIAVIVSVILYYTYGLLQGSLYFRYMASAIAIVMLVKLMRSLNRIEGEADLAEAYRRQQEETESRMMLAQINSHFFNNTMNIIRGLIKFDPDAAYKMTSDFCRYLRYRVTTSSDKGSICEFSEEMKAVRAYADICVVRYDSKLNVEYNIDTYDFRIPMLTVEPFVENAIYHGIFEGSGEGTVTIRAYQNENGFAVTIQDNGRGFDVTLHDDKNTDSIQKVINIMAKYEGCSVNIDSAVGRGTTVTLQYPEEL